MVVKNKVPYFSQYDTSIPKKWQPRACGIAALWMALSTTSRETIPSVSELIQEGVAGSAYAPGIGWKHDELVLLAKKHGSRTRRNEYKKQNEFTKGVNTIKKTIDRGGVPIVSITVPGVRHTHLVPLVGYDDKNVFYHEPARKKKGQKVKGIALSWSEFAERWRRLVIFIESH